MELGWENNIARCELVEKTLGEMLSGIFAKIKISDEETKFI